MLHVSSLCEQVHIAVQAIPNGSRRLKSWQAGLEKHGAVVVQVHGLNASVMCFTVAWYLI